MKRHYLTVLVSALLLAGCHHDSSTDQNTAPANVLHIKGEGINRQVVLDPKDISVSFSAKGNLPMDSVTFGNLSKSKDFLLAYLTLLPDSKQVDLPILILDSNDKAKELTALNCFNLNCSDHTRYTLLKGRTASTLKLEFNQTPNWFYTYDHVLKNFTRIIPVQVSAALQYSIPNNWPVLQRKRFPDIDVQGQAMFDGKIYRVSSVNALPRITRIEGKEYQREYEMILKHGSAILSLYLRVGNPELPQHDATIYVSVIDESGYYQAKLPFPQAYWLEDADDLKIQFDKVVLVDNDSNISKMLNVSFRIPKIKIHASLDGKLLQVYGTFSPARASNDQKTYDISLGDGELLQTLRLVQELKGHVSLKYSEGEQDYSCGNRELTCAGLSMDADQKTWRFNSVKLGDKTLNGTAYIPGVFE